MRKRLIVLNTAIILAIASMSAVSGGNRCSASENLSEPAAAEETMETGTHVPLERPDYTALDYVELGDYTGLSVTVDAVVVTKEEIDAEIREEMDAVQEALTAGSIENGDIANINYVGRKDGIEFAGGSADNYDLEIGSGTFIPGFEEQLIGMEIGSTGDITVTFPEDYYSKDLAGQEAVFTVTVNSVKRFQDLSDEMISKATDGEYTTVDSYRQYQKEQIEEAKKAEQEEEIDQELMSQLYSTCTIQDYPEGMIEYGVDRITAYYTQIAESYFGMTFEDFRDNYLQEDEDTYNSQALDMAKEGLKQEMILTAIAEKENLEISEEEFEEGCAKYAGQSGISVEEFKEAYEDRDLMYTFRMDKAKDFVRTNAVMTVNNKVTGHNDSIDLEIEADDSNIETVEEKDGTKDQEEEEAQRLNEEDEQEIWECPKCGLTVTGNFCSNCGEKKPS